MQVGLGKLDVNDARSPTLYKGQIIFTVTAGHSTLGFVFIVLHWALDEGGENPLWFVRVDK